MLKNTNQVQVYDDSSSSSLGFECCFKPFIIILKFLTGVPINHSSLKSKKSCLLVFYGSILLLINVAINGYYIFDNYQKNFSFNQTAAERNITSSSAINIRMTDKINLGIDIINEIFFTFGCHCCFFILSTFVNNVWDCLIVIERQLQISTQIYKRIRKMVWLIIFVLFMVISTSIPFLL